MEEGPVRFRKTSTSMASDTSSVHGPALTQPHRRMSRMPDMNPYSRRMSMMRRPSIASHRTDDSKKQVQFSLHMINFYSPRFCRTGRYKRPTDEGPQLYSNLWRLFLLGHCHPSHSIELGIFSTAKVLGPDITGTLISIKFGSRHSQCTTKQ